MLDVSRAGNVIFIISELWISKLANFLTESHIHLTVFQGQNPPIHTVAWKLECLHTHDLMKALKELDEDS